MSTKSKLIFRLLITDATSGFRAYRGSALTALAEQYPSDYPEPEAVVLLARRGCRIVEVPVTMRERQGGASSIRGWREIYYMIKVILALSVEMLRKRNGG